MPTLSALRAGGGGTHSVTCYVATTTSLPALSVGRIAVTCSMSGRVSDNRFDAARRAITERSKRARSCCQGKLLSIVIRTSNRS